MGPLNRKKPWEKGIYTYPGTCVLINKMNIRDFDVLQEYERKMSDLGKLTVHKIKGCFDKDHICRIHEHLFGDIYDWAGHVRNVSLWKDDMAFAAVKDIDKGLEGLHAALEADNYLIGMKDKDKASQALTDCFMKLNHFHPLREGNGRTTRAVLSMLAENAGFELSFSHVSREEWIYASRLAEYGTDFVMRDILRQGLESKADIEAGREAYDKLKRAADDIERGNDEEEIGKKDPEESLDKA